MTDQNNGGNGSSKKPETVIRDGSMAATMWRNPGQYGDRFATSIDKSFKDEKTGEWHKTSYFSGTDLLKAARLAEEAYQKETELKREQSLSRSQNKDVEQARNAYREQSESMDKGGKPAQSHTQTR